MERLESDIVIAGGGIAGLTAAIAFAAERFRVVCVDSAPPVTEEGAASSDLRSTAFLMPSVALFERAGLWRRLAPFGAALRIMRLADAGGVENRIRRIADFAATEIGQEAFGYNLPNWLLRREMVAEIAGRDAVTLLAPATVEGVVPRLRDVVVTLSGDRQVRAPLLIAADGRDSFVRSALGIGVRTQRYGQKALVFAVAHDRPHEGVSTEIHRTGGPFTLVPLPDRDGQPMSAVVWMDRGAEATRLMGLAAPAFNAALNARACGVLGSLRLVGERRLWPIISRQAERLAGPRTALVAEAAHVMPPIGAQGLNTSLADIAALLDLVIAARTAGQDIGAPDLLTRYARQRAPDVAMRAVGIDMLNRAAMAEAQPIRDLRNVGLGLLHGATPLRHLAMRTGLGA
ncbi:MAG: FAD-dependent monooxygenase [Pseudomonadota bacterium]